MGAATRACPGAGISSQGHQSRPIVASSSPSRFLAIGDLAFSTANDPDGPGLWRTDGSEAGTVRLISGVAVDHLVDVGGTLFCVATAGDDTTLWTSDGTPDGTRQIAEIPAIGDDDRYDSNTTIGQMLFFVTGNFQIGLDRWRSDGTATGTIRLKHLGPPGGGSQIPWFRVLGSTLIFTGWDEATGYEPWRSDGTPEGTTLLRDVRGLRHLALLLAHPHEEIPALVLEHNGVDPADSALCAQVALHDARERARVNVTKAIALPLKRIAAHHPLLGRHLDATVRTGTFCGYTPDPRVPLRWTEKRTTVHRFVAHHEQLFRPSLRLGNRRTRTWLIKSGGRPEATVT